MPKNLSWKKKTAKLEELVDAFFSNEYITIGVVGRKLPKLLISLAQATKSSWEVTAKYHDEDSVDFIIGESSDDTAFIINTNFSGLEHEISNIFVRCKWFDLESTLEDLELVTFKGTYQIRREVYATNSEDGSIFKICVKYTSSSFTDKVKSVLGSNEVLKVIHRDNLDPKIRSAIRYELKSQI